MCAYSYIRTKIDFPSKSSSTVPKVLFSYLLVFMHLTDLVSIGIKFISTNFKHEKYPE